MRVRAMQAVAAVALVLACCGAPAAVHEVQVVNTSFSPRTLNIEAGDTVRWINAGAGFHNVVADSGEFSNQLGASWTFDHTFDAAGEFPYFCEAHGGPDGQGMSGTVNVAGAPPPPPPPPPPDFVVNEGLAGSWYNPATVGQGILLEVSDQLGVLAMAWFTWTLEGGDYDWLTGSGSVEGNSVTVSLFRSSGGRFDDPAPVENVAAGTVVITFSDCSHATFAFDLVDPEVSGEFPLERILPPNQACVEANPAPEE